MAKENFKKIRAAFAAAFTIAMAGLALEIPILAQAPEKNQEGIIEPLETPEYPVAEEPAGLDWTIGIPPSTAPVFVSLAPNINDFGVFADGGWDGAWYAGFNTCWIVRLPPSPSGTYSKAFIGAKLGRAKAQAVPGKPPWEKTIIPGKIYMAISSTAAFSAAQSFYLAETRDIPPEPDWDNPSRTGHSEWFWTEVSLKLVNYNGPNYLALWSSSEELQSISSSPVLAAAMGGKEVGAWLNRDIHGAPPREPNPSPGTPLSYYMPSLAIKLIPSNSSLVLVRNLSASPQGGNLQVQFSVLGEDVESAWVEASTDRMEWSRLDKKISHPPFIFSVPVENLPTQQFFLRGASKDVLENTGYSPAVFVELSVDPILLRQQKMEKQTPPKKTGRPLPKD